MTHLFNALTPTSPLGSLGLLGHSGGAVLRVKKLSRDKYGGKTENKKSINESRAIYISCSALMER